MLQVGDVVAGRYLVQQVLSAGDTTVVHRAEDLVLARQVALRVLRPELAADPGQRERFRQEAHVGTVYDGGERDGLLYVVTSLAGAVAPPAEAATQVLRLPPPEAAPTLVPRVLPPPSPTPQVLPPLPPAREPVARRRLAPAAYAACAVVVLLAAVVGGLLGVRSGRTTPSTDSDTGPAAAAAPAEWEQLASRLPDTVFRDCRPADGPQPPERPVALRCTSASGGADELLVRRWASREAMTRDFAASYAKYPRLPCSTGWNHRSTWSGGGLACYDNSQGAAVVMYEYDDEAVQVLAVRADGDDRALFGWWRGQAQVPLQAG